MLKDQCERIFSSIGGKATVSLDLDGLQFMPLYLEQVKDAPPIMFEPIGCPQWYGSESGSYLDSKICKQTIICHFSLKLLILRNVNKFKNLNNK